MTETFAGILGIDSVDTAWQEKGICAQTDPELFFPEEGNTSRTAKALCIGRCSVRSECLDYALVNKEEYGIWGGLSEDERSKLKKPAR